MESKGEEESSSYASGRRSSLSTSRPPRKNSSGSQVQSKPAVPSTEPSAKSSDSTSVRHTVSERLWSLRHFLRCASSFLDAHPLKQHDLNGDLQCVEFATTDNTYYKKASELRRQWMAYQILHRAIAQHCKAQSTREARRQAPQQSKAKPREQGRRRSSGGLGPALSLDTLQFNQNLVLQQELQHAWSSIPASVVAEGSVVVRWMRGDVSNLEYLLYLNWAAGRLPNDPFNHPVVPWVTDFSRARGGWRDLSKSKFRLHKGDDQLLATYRLGVPQHHIPEPLSDLTVFVYKARYTPKETLQKEVRGRFVAREYPADMASMYKWSPDDCIPEFFTDPQLFRSIHDDLEDLGIPAWCDTPEAFIEYHRGLLESDHVSARLHEWIDLTFGYKLSGKAAYDNLNVPLKQSFHNYQQYTPIPTFVQLFRSPHPRRVVPKPGTGAAGAGSAPTQGCDVTATGLSTALYPDMTPGGEAFIEAFDAEEFIRESQGMLKGLEMARGSAGPLLEAIAVVEALLNLAQHHDDGVDVDAAVNTEVLSLQGWLAYLRTRAEATASHEELLEALHAAFPPAFQQLWELSHRHKGAASTGVTRSDFTLQRCSGLVQGGDAYGGSLAVPLFITELEAAAMEGSAAVVALFPSILRLAVNMQDSQRVACWLPPLMRLSNAALQSNQGCPASAIALVLLLAAVCDVNAFLLEGLDHVLKVLKDYRKASVEGFDSSTHDERNHAVILLQCLGNTVADTLGPDMCFRFVLPPLLSVLCDSRWSPVQFPPLETALKDFINGDEGHGSKAQHSLPLHPEAVVAAAVIRCSHFSSTTVAPVAATLIGRACRLLGLNDEDRAVELCSSSKDSKDSMTRGLGVTVRSLQPWLPLWTTCSAETAPAPAAPASPEALLRALVLLQTAAPALAALGEAGRQVLRDMSVSWCAHSLRMLSNAASSPVEVETSGLLTPWLAVAVLQAIAKVHMAAFNGPLLSIPGLASAVLVWSLFLSEEAEYQEKGAGQYSVTGLTTQLLGLLTTSSTSVGHLSAALSTLTAFYDEKAAALLPFAASRLEALRAAVVRTERLNSDRSSKGEGKEEEEESKGASSSGASGAGLPFMHTPAWAPWRWRHCFIAESSNGSPSISGPGPGPGGFVSQPPPPAWLIETNDRLSHLLFHSQVPVSAGREPRGASFNFRATLLPRHPRSRRKSNSPFPSPLQPLGELLLNEERRALRMFQHTPSPTMAYFPPPGRWASDPSLFRDSSSSSLAQCRGTAAAVPSAPSLLSPFRLPSNATGAEHWQALKSTAIASIAEGGPQRSLLAVGGAQTTVLLYSTQQDPDGPAKFLWSTDYAEATIPDGFNLAKGPHGDLKKLTFLSESHLAVLTGHAIVMDCEKGKSIFSRPLKSRGLNIEAFGGGLAANAFAASGPSASACLSSSRTFVVSTMHDVQLMDLRCPTPSQFPVLSTWRVPQYEPPGPPAFRCTATWAPYIAAVHEKRLLLFDVRKGGGVVATGPAKPTTTWLAWPAPHEVVGMATPTGAMTFWNIQPGATSAADLAEDGLSIAAAASDRLDVRVAPLKVEAVGKRKGGQTTKASCPTIISSVRSDGSGWSILNGRGQALQHLSIGFECEVTEAEVSLQAHAANSSAYITSLCRSQLGDRCIAGWSDGGVTLI